MDTLFSGYSYPLEATVTLPSVLNKIAYCQEFGKQHLWVSNECTIYALLCIIENVEQTVVLESWN